MFGSSALEVAIGIVFVYLLLSMICTMINEMVSTWCGVRSETLYEGIKNLLNDPNFTGLAQQIYNHGLIDGISQNAADNAVENKKPSYMHASTFSMALLDILGSRGAGESAVHLELAVVQKKAALDALLKGDPQKSNTATQQADTDYKNALEEAQKARAVKDLHNKAAITALQGHSIPEALDAAQRNLTNAKDNDTLHSTPITKQAITEAQMIVLELLKVSDATQPTANSKQAIDDARRAIINAKLDVAKAVDAANSTNDTKQALTDAQVDLGNVLNAETALQTADSADKANSTSATQQAVTDAKSTLKRALQAGANDTTSPNVNVQSTVEHLNQVASDFERALDAGRQLAAEHPDPLGNIQKGIEGLPNGHTKETLLVLIAKTKREANLIANSVTTDAKKVEMLGQNIEKWFDSSMDRVGGWYKRYTQRWLFIYALVIVLLSNADTIALAKRFTRDNTLRASVVAASEKIIVRPEPAPTTTATPAKTPAKNPTDKPADTSDFDGGGNAASAPTETPVPIKTPVPTATPSSSAIADETVRKKVLDAGSQLNLPLGWVIDANDPHAIEQVPPSLFYMVNWDLKTLQAWLSKIVGLLITVFAVSLGAPFWFDTLSKLINLRGAGTPPGEKKKSAGDEKKS